MPTLLRLDQVRRPDDFDDSLSPATIAGIEGSAVDYQDFIKGLLSQVKQVIHGTDAGNWWDNPNSVFGNSATLKTLYNRATLENKLIIVYRMIIQDITVGGSDNWVLLDAAGEPPSVNIAIGGTTEGAVVAQLAGAVGSNSLDEVAGPNALRPKNMCAIFDATSGDALLSNGRRIWGLLQVGNAATDGNAFGIAGNDLGQISFVRENSTYDDLEACPAADIQGKSIIYSYSWRVNLNDVNEAYFRGDLHEADPTTAVSISLDSAYDGGEFMTVDSSDVDIRLSDTKAWVFREGSGGSILARVYRNDTTGSIFEVAAAVDSYDNNAAANDFAQGADFDTNDQAIGIGTNAAGEIDSTSLKINATTGNLNLDSAASVNFTTVRETALPLDDATAGAISGLFGQSFASIAAAIKYAGEKGGVDLTVDIFTAGTNYAQGANIPAATLDLTTFSGDMNTPATVNLFLFLNGRLLYGGNGTTKNDWYAGDTPASGDIKVDFVKGIKTGDVIITIALKE